MPLLEDFGITNCGIDVNITNQRNAIRQQAQVFLDLRGQIGKPEIVGQVETAVGEAVTAIKDQVEGLIPEIPDVVGDLQGNLRDSLGGIASLVAEGKDALETAAAAAATAASFVGISNLRGMANVDLNDLTNSALSLGGTFDPCSAVSGIPNITSSMQALPSIQPKLGGTLKALPISIPDQSFTDSFTRTQFTVAKQNIGGMASRLTARL